MNHAPTPKERPDVSNAVPPPLSHAALFVRFLRFGCLAFGSPIAQIAMIRRQLVDEERWITPDQFNRLLAVMQALPGPEAHELCVHMGIRAKGRIGGLLAGLGFMLPGLVLMLLAAWLYQRYAAASPLLAAAFLGAQAAVVAIVVRAVHRIGEHILIGAHAWAIAGFAAVATLAGASFWIVLPAAGLVSALVVSRRLGWAAAVVAVAVAAAVVASFAGVGDGVRETLPGTGAPTAAALFVAGLKGGLLTFGGAYTAIPFVRADTVGRGWLSDAQFLDGVALASVLPAPLVIFATFAGWAGGGLFGALAITAGMFLPAFAFSLLFYERLEAVLEHHRLQAFLAGIAAAVVGMIAVTAVDLGRSLMVDAPEPVVLGLIFAVALAVLYRWRSIVAGPAVLALGGIAATLMLG